MLHITGNARHGVNAAMALPRCKSLVAQDMALDHHPQGPVIPPQCSQQQPRIQTVQPQHVLEEEITSCTHQQQQQQQQQEAKRLSTGCLLANRHEISDEVSQVAQSTF